jgi:hypothetical protein
MPLNEYQLAFLKNAMVSKTNVIDPDTGAPLDWSNLGGGVSEEQLAAALDSIEVGDTFVTNVTENQTFITQNISQITQVINDKKNQNDGIAGLDGNAKLNKNQLPASILLGAFELTLEGAGAPLTTGVKYDFEVPFDCTLTGHTVLADQTGSIVIGIWKDSYANFPPTVDDSVVASAPPTLSSAQKAQDNTLTGWTKSLSAGDILRFNVVSASAVQRVALILRYTRA